MYPNLPDAELQEIMLKLLESTFKYRSQHSLRSIELRWSYANDHTCPVAREASWSSKQLQPITDNSKSHVWVGPYTIFRWLKCVLNEGCVQFGPHMYRQTSGVFMGTSPAPELANDFAFWHEFEFLTHMVNEHKQYGPGRYPFDFIPNTRVVPSGILMTSSLSLLAIRLGLATRYYFTKWCLLWHVP